MYSLSNRSLRRLNGTHPDLIDIVKGAIRITKRDFTVIEGVRSEDRQELLLETGASTTLRSKHLVGRAVDLGALHKNKYSKLPPHYNDLYEAMNAASLVLNGVPIVWGGMWKTFKDYGHFELHPQVADMWNGPVPAFLTNGT